VKNQRTIGFVGHFSQLKGVETLLHAFFMLTKSVRDVELVLVGDGPLRKRLECMSNRMGLTGKVIFTGYIKNPLDVMREFDILVVPSLYEGCPSVILEAFSADVPVLGGNAGGIPELLKAEQLLFPVSNQEELFYKLKEIISSEFKYSEAKTIIVERKREFTFDHTYRLEQVLTNLICENSHTQS